MNNHAELNRPVHLALRDVHYERATELLNASCSQTPEPPRIAGYEEILFLLRTAREHGHLALRDTGGNEKNEQFCRFINMLAGNVKAILSMLNLQHSVEEKESFFFSFLEVNHASVALQAEEYERRARDIIRSMYSTLELAAEAYEGLKQNDLGALDDSGRERYNKAAEHHRNLHEQRPELPEYKGHKGSFGQGT
jgi:hypothetical protein